MTKAEKEQKRASGTKLNSRFYLNTLTNTMTLCNNRGYPIWRKLKS